LARLLSHPTRIPRRLRARRRGSERAQLLARLPKNGVVAEVGTWRGDFAAVILNSSRPARLYLIDPWEHRSEEKYQQASYGGRREGQQEMDAIHDGVLERFSSEIESGRVVIRRARSLEAAGSLSPQSLDWVYIDADHSYEGVRDDLESYFPLVKPGGFLAGDDYGHVGSWFGEGVTRAVDEFSGRCAELTIIGTQFLLRKH
jgi:predicted O-methyltransferase YrrM